MRVLNKQIQTNQALNVNSNGPASPLKSIFMYTIAATITGTPTGTIRLQASADPETDDTQPSGVPFPQPKPSHWADITGSTFVVVGPQTVMWNVRYIGYNYVRVVYTDTSGGTSTATMDVIINCKGN